MEISEEERQSIEEVEKRLEIYKFIRDVSGMIKIFTAKPPSFARETFANFNVSFIEPSNLSLANIVEAAKNVINFLPKEENLPQVKVDWIIKLEEKNFRIGPKDTRQYSNLLFRFS